ncbi:MAG: hypothetical protein LBR89_00080 [Holosporales bacterium]|jgi:hypothetical protein|nr:hypothetical protein [Holosporales bacterium]
MIRILLCTFVLAALVPSMLLFANTRKETRSRFSPEEDNSLIEIVQSLEDNNASSINWEYVATRMPGRRARQCRERYKHYLSSSNHTPITQAEGNVLWDLYGRIGPRWTKLATFVVGRTDLDVKRYIRLRSEQNRLFRSTQDLQRRLRQNILHSFRQNNNYSLPAVTLQHSSDADAILQPFAATSMNGSQSVVPQDFTEQPAPRVIPALVPARWVTVPDAPVVAPMPLSDDSIFQYPMSPIFVPSMDETDVLFPADDQTSVWPPIKADRYPLL